MEHDGKVGQAEAAAVKTRTDTVNYALLAEVNTFHEQRVKDIKSSHQHFLQEQIKFYQKVSFRCMMHSRRALMSIISDHRETARNFEDVRSMLSRESD